MMMNNTCKYYCNDRHLFPPFICKLKYKWIIQLNLIINIASYCTLLHIVMIIQVCNRGTPQKVI